MFIISQFLRFFSETVGNLGNFSWQVVKNFVLSFSEFYNFSEPQSCAKRAIVTNFRIFRLFLGNGWKFGANFCIQVAKH